MMTVLMWLSLYLSCAFKHQGSYRGRPLLSNAATSSASFVASRFEVDYEGIPTPLCAQIAQDTL